MIEHCPCGTGSAFVACCGAIIARERVAATAEELMRSRYSAYVKRDVDHLVRTTWPAVRTPVLAEGIKTWMDQVEWTRLNVLAATEGRVEFVAEYIANGQSGQHHERSIFNKLDGEWFYVGEE